MPDVPALIACRERNAARWNLVMLVLAGVSLVCAQLGVI